MTEFTDCPNCGTPLKGRLMSSVLDFPQSRVDIINEYHETTAAGYCTKCGKDLFKKYKAKYEAECKGLSERIMGLISAIPVISTHSPLHWDYAVLQLVTGQSTTGTGVFTEFASDFTDLFGLQSGRHNKKLKAGEDLCFAQLRKQTLDVGGNAVIATDIDYSELGSGKGMIMVCMAGTAVNLKNVDVLGAERSAKISDLVSSNARLNYLLSLKAT